MAHLLESMAFVRETPWHGLGNRLSEHQPLEVWLREAGMDWTIEQNDVMFQVAAQAGFNVRPYAENQVLYRSDTLAPLSVVSSRYKVVQPREVLEFYRDLVQAGGFELETAGVLKGGKKLWALARTGQETILKGGDRIGAYLLLATSCDGTLATTAQFTSVRVVCNNTLQLATAERNGAIKVPHSTNFDPAQVKRELGLGLSAWDQFMVNIKALADRKVNKIEAMSYLVDVLGIPQLPLADQPNQKALQHVSELFNGQGLGSTLASANGTAWGLVNAVTQYIDHDKRSKSQDHRLDSAWFGQGAQLKQKALEKALLLAA